MTLVHVSYYPDRAFHDAESWLTKAQFYNGVLEAIAGKMNVHDVKVINYSGVVNKNGVKHHFLKDTNTLLPFQLNRYIRKLNPDAVLVAGLLFPLQVIFLKMQLPQHVKVLVQHHAEKPLVGLKAMIQNIADRYIDDYLFTSAELAEDWTRRKLVSKTKVREVMEASSFFLPMDKQIARSCTAIDAGIAYLWVGKMNENKDPVTAVKGFIPFSNVNPGAKLYMIYSNDAMLNAVRKIIKEANAEENILLLGKMPHEKMQYWYNSADFIISTSHYEGSGVAVCEAMSCGCIPVLTNIPSFRMMSDNGRCGMLFDKGDEESLARALLQTAGINIEYQKNKVLQFYDKKLSFKAIAAEIEALI